MSSEPPITTVGTILTKQGERVYQAALPNGKVVMAHVPAKLVSEVGALLAGDKVRMELTTYDFSTARIGARMG